MFDATSNKRSRTLVNGPLPGAVVNFNNQWFDTLTGRLGYAVAPSTLFYFQGGGAWAHTSTNVTAGGVQIGQTSATRSGWTIGGGVEWMFAPHWTCVSRGQLHGLRVQVRSCSYSGRHNLCGRLCFHRDGQRNHGVDRCELQVLIRNPLAKLKAPDPRI